MRPMHRFSFRGLTLLLALGGHLVGCGGGGGSDAVEIRVDTFNVGLAGAFVPNESARRDPVIAAVAALDSDIVCLQEVWQQSDKDRVVAAAMAAYPYSASFTTGYDTAITDATDQNGEVPPAPTTAPCAGEALSANLEAALTCIDTNCSTMPGSDDGRTTSAECAEANCVGAVATLLTGGAESLRCYSCLTTSLPTETLGDMRDLCTTEVNADIAFRGQSSTMILSRHPLTNVQNFVMPGTWNRRQVTIATATLPNGTELDVYCNHLTPVFNGLAFPYTGQYGEGETGPGGWAAEQLLQTEKLIAQVQARSGTTRPAVILGDFNTSPSGVPGIVAEAAETFNRLSSVYTPASAPDFTPTCTFCPETNANFVEDSDSVWLDHIFLANFGADATVSTEVTFTENLADTGSGLVPLSDHYGLAAVVRVD